MSTFLRPASSKEFHGISCLILRVKVKTFCILTVLFAKFIFQYYKQEHLKERAKVKNDQFSCFKIYSDPK